MFGGFDIFFILYTCHIGYLFNYRLSNFVAVPHLVSIQQIPLLEN